MGSEHSLPGAVKGYTHPWSHQGRLPSCLSQGYISRLMQTFQKTTWEVQKHPSHPKSFSLAEAALEANSLALHTETGSLSCSEHMWLVWRQRTPAEAQVRPFSWAHMFHRTLGSYCCTWRGTPLLYLIKSKNEPSGNGGRAPQRASIVNCSPPSKNMGNHQKKGRW